MSPAPSLVSAPDFDLSSLEMVLKKIQKVQILYNFVDFHIILKYLERSSRFATLGFKN